MLNIEDGEMLKCSRYEFCIPIKETYEVVCFFDNIDKSDVG